MSPDSDGNMRIVRCAFDKAVIDEQVKDDLRTAISRIHEATIYVTELLNIEVRRQLEMGHDCPDYLFDKNKLAHAFQSVVTHDDKYQAHPLFQKQSRSCQTLSPSREQG